MMKYEWKKIDDFTDVATGGTPSRRIPEYWDEGTIPWLNSGELNQDIITYSRNFITKKGLKNSSARMMLKDSVLVALTGSTTGKTAYLTFEACANQSVTGILPSKNHNSQYLYHFLKTQKEVIFRKAWGAAQPHISQQFVKDFKVPLPNLETQKRIAQVLSNCENLIQKRKESIELLDELLKSTFLEMFGDPVRNNKKLKFVSLACYGDFKNGLNYAKNEVGLKVRYLGVGDFKNHNRISNMHLLKKISLFKQPSDDYFLKNNDLVFVRSNGNKELVGRCVVVNPEKEKVTFSGFCIRFRPKSKLLNTLYLSHLFTIENFKKKMLQSGRGANIQNINQKLLGELKIPLPEPEQQQKFVDIVEKVEAIKKKYQTHLQELENLYGIISQKAFKGELDLSKVLLRETKYFSENPNETPKDFKKAMNALLKEKEQVKSGFTKPTLNDVEKILKTTIKDGFKAKLFSIEDIENILLEKNITIDNTVIKNYLRNAMAHNAIGQEFSGSTKQVMFKLKK